MNIEEFVLTRSYLPKNGTWTMLDHVKAMLMTMSGTCTKLVVEDETELLDVYNEKDKISVNNISVKAEITDSLNIISVKSDIERISI